MTPFQANVPVAGVGVMPGNYIFADSAGAVVIPESQIREVLQGALAVAAEDAAAIASIKVRIPPRPQAITERLAPHPSPKAR